MSYLFFVVTLLYVFGFQVTVAELGTVPLIGTCTSQRELAPLRSGNQRKSAYEYR